MTAANYIERLSDREMPAQDIAWLRRMLATQPPDIADALAARHERTYRETATRGIPNAMCPANIELRKHVESSKWLIPMDFGEENLRGWAKRRSTECDASMRRVNGDEMDTYAAGYEVASRFGLQPPTPKGNVTLYGCIARLRDERWWRRQARKIHGRRLERDARSLGLVHKKAGLYISEAGFTRWRGRQIVNARTLNDSVAVCETGEEMNLAEIADAGVGNPSVRRKELMARIAGTERYAKKQVHAALFVTLTVPSKLHAVDSRSLRPGTGRNVTPRDAQNWLTNQWAKARAKLNRDDVNVYGLRVAEPHHDGTPHWHLLLFVSEKHLLTLRATLKHYALDGSTDPARIKHACKLVDIDAERGSATGYVAKYVSKAIDGYAIDDATTLDADGYQASLQIEASDAAHRARAWASQWGIRQFQFIGTPAIGPWRELRRLEGPIKNNPRAESLRQAADDGDYARYMDLMGGAAIKASERPAHVRYTTDTECGRYGEAKRRPHLDASGVTYMTRPVRWRIEYSPGGDSCCGGNAEQLAPNVTGSGAAVIPAAPVTGNPARNFLNEFQRTALAQRRSREHLDSWK